MNTHIASRSAFSWHHVPKVNKANKILPVEIMIGQVLSGQLTKQLIQDLECSIALNKRFVLTLNYEISILKLNSSEHIKPGFHLQQTPRPRHKKTKQLYD